MNFYCLFCDQRCKHLLGSQLWSCTPCHAQFLTGDSTEYLKKIILTHHRSNHDFYQVHLDIAANETVVEFYKFHEENPNWQAYDELPKSRIVARFKPMSNHFTPSNLAAKLQTILTFQ